MSQDRAKLRVRGVFQLARNPTGIPRALDREPAPLVLPALLAPTVRAGGWCVLRIDAAAIVQALQLSLGASELSGGWARLEAIRTLQGGFGFLFRQEFWDAFAGEWGAVWSRNVFGNAAIVAALRDRATLRAVLANLERTPDPRLRLETRERDGVLWVELGVGQVRMVGVVARNFAALAPASLRPWLEELVRRGPGDAGHVLDGAPERLNGAFSWNGTLPHPVGGWLPGARNASGILVRNARILRVDGRVR